MKKKLELIIRKILMKKYPELLEIIELEEEGINKFNLIFETNNMIPVSTVDLITNELKILYRMINPANPNNPYDTPSIRCAFREKGRDKSYDRVFLAIDKS